DTPPTRVGGGESRAYFAPASIHPPAARMIAPIDFTRLQSALSMPRGWLELLLTLVCIAIGWWFDRRLAKARNARAAVAARVDPHLAFPLIALALVYVASLAWERAIGSPVLLPLAAPEL